jgi:hypothetical protein
MKDLPSEMDKNELYLKADNLVNEAEWPVLVQYSFTRLTNIILDHQIYI